jgi:putative tryptophan/tyrosine transport system substrate-binding protein
MKRMNQVIVCSLVLLALAGPSLAEDKTYKIEVLQVMKEAVPFQNAYNGFVKELEKNGIVKGKNLIINRKMIDFDVEKGGVFKKVGVLMEIKSEAQKIADRKPDLVLTIGTAATKYGKDKIISAGIPLVFTAVAVPQAAGCKSLTEAGPGFTGATLHMDMKDALKIVKLAYPTVKTLGIIHSDDDSAIAHAAEAKKEGPGLGLTFITKEISKTDSIKPAAQELIAKGVQAFIVPLDTYYGVRKTEPTIELAAISRSTKLPIISFMLHKNPGGVLYVGSDFTVIGSLAGQQAVKILKDGAKPESLPILRQQDLMILVDVKQMQAVGVQLPMEILKLAKPVE